MKKLMGFLAATILFTGVVSAQKLKADQVPAAVKAAFAKHFPNVTAKWEKEDTHYEAGFHQNGKEMSALFDANGNLTETEVAIKVSELPAAVHQYIQKNYPGAKVKEASIITLADGTKHYEAEVNGQDLIFDANGNFIKAVKA
ncbi:PepSY-like domain-containing protein [Hydrotalea sp.]|uniref:PepSY-like domain-containing protein n=1 Tax=Hydrotalea sp. TaxID=2881279 RepID=UPI003D0A8566